MTLSPRKFLIFLLQKSLYALDLAQVAEVCDPPKIWSIPLAPPCYIGSLNFHGEIVAVMDLPFFLGLTGRNKPNKLLVLKHEEASLAFLVDTVVKIVSEEGVSVIKTADKKFAVATIGLNEGEAIQLDLEAIVCKAEISMQKKAVIIKNITNK